MFVLSSDPYTQRTQLNELLERSRQALARLTAPIPIMDFDLLFMSSREKERKISMYDSREHVNDYVPPPSRYVKEGHTRFSSMDFD